MSGSYFPPNTNSGGNGVEPFEQTFNQSSLTIANLLIVNHSLGRIPSGISFYDKDLNEFEIDSLILSPGNPTNVIVVDLSSYVPIIGTCKVKVI